MPLKRLRPRRTFAVRAAAVVVLATVFAFSLGSARSARAAVGDCTPGSYWGTLNASFASQVLDLVNQHRSAMGLGTLSTSPTLTNAAGWKSLHMAYYGYMQHDDPAPPVARTVSDRLAACGYPIGSVSWGENIAYGYTSPQAVMNAWLSSPGHRANIENAGYKAIGIGVAQAANGVVYWTQDFGSLVDTGSTVPPPPTVLTPTVSLTSTPPSSTTATTASFGWTTTNSPTSTTCSLDGATPAPCSSPSSYGGLGTGSHNFVVTVANGAGSSHAAYTWTVTATAPPPPSATAPTVTFTRVTRRFKSVTFLWTTTGSPTSVTCSLDAAPATPCTSPATVSGIGRGSHTFVVSAANAGGSGFARYTWSQ
jgi:uncharacterized protein YkwD